MKLFTTFHLNLSFSSIEEEDQKVIIEKCYWPLLSLCDIDGVKIGIEMSGHTAERVNQLDRSWIDKLRALSMEGKVEFVGSGYEQIISPLVPYKVNYMNQELGLESYQKTLSLRPKVALINEMAFSSSAVDLLKDFGYESLIMDENNIKLSKDDIPNHASGLNNNDLPILWSNSLTFQKLQQYVHGDINLDSYMEFFKKIKSSKKTFSPFYTNDVECFDYRPGRFNYESLVNPNGEWERIKNLMKYLQEKEGVKWILPSEALTILKSEKKKVSHLVTSSNPAPVKKQPKYNITRWAVTGRGDTWLNTLCFRFLKELNKRKDNKENRKLWRSLCILWSSDLRTHLTEKRWKKVNQVVEKFSKELEVDFKEIFVSKPLKAKKKINIFNSFKDKSFEIYTDKEKTVLSFLSKNIKMDLNLRKGLTIKSLKFDKTKEPIMGTLSHGFFNSIELGADFYSGGVQSQDFVRLKKITDLEPVEPRVWKEKDEVFFQVYLKTIMGDIQKTIIASLDKKQINLRYDFSSWNRGYYFLRAGFLTLFPNFWNQNIKLSYISGGQKEEILDLSGEFDHSEPISNIVSNTTGLPVTDGYIKIYNKLSKLKFSWDPSRCAVLPMLVNKKDENGNLIRLIFSLQEMDETLKEGGPIPNFNLSISDF